MNKQKKSKSFNSRHLTHCVEKERKYFSAFLSGFKTSYLFEVLEVMNIVEKELKDMF